jgi:hypothetical protein
MGPLGTLITLLMFSLAEAQTPDAQLINEVFGTRMTPEAACADEAPQCTEKYLGTGKANPATICQSFDQNQNPFLAEYPDGSVVPNPFAMDEAVAGQNSGRATDQRLLSMFRNPATSPELVRNFNDSIELMKNVVREQITQGASPSTLHPHQRYLLQRMDQLEVIVDYDTAGCDPANGYPFNARYQGTSNTMYICPILTHMTPEATLALLAHELGHFADPCNYARNYRYSASLMNIPDGKERKARMKEEIVRCLSDLPAEEKTRFSDWATNTTRMQSRGIPIYVTEGENNQNQLYAERLRRCGIVNAPVDPVPPRTYEGTPYLPLLSCIHQRHSNTQTPINASTAISPNTCERGTVVAETIADYVSSSVIARAINRFPERFPAQRRQFFPQFYSSVACANDASEEYLPARDRISVFLQSPTVQRGVNCEGSTLPAACPIPDSLSAESRAP